MFVQGKKSSYTVNLLRYNKRPGTEINFLALALENAISKNELKYMQSFEYYFEYIDKTGMQKLIAEGQKLFKE